MIAKLGVVGLTELSLGASGDAAVGDAPEGDIRLRSFLRELRRTSPARQVRLSLELLRAVLADASSESCRTTSTHSGRRLHLRYVGRCARRSALGTDPIRTRSFGGTAQV